MNQKHIDALEIANRIRINGSVTDSKRWYIGLAAPMLLVVGLALEPSGVLPAILLFCGNTLTFFYRIWTWKMASKKLELLVLPAGAFLVICVVAYLFQSGNLTWISPVWILGAFFTPMLVLRTVLAATTNAIADDLEAMARSESD